jgi:hypothetical protein
MDEPVASVFMAGTQTVCVVVVSTATDPENADESVQTGDDVACRLT